MGQFHDLFAKSAIIYMVDRCGMRENASIAKLRLGYGHREPSDRHREPVECRTFKY